jgi:hypothetical protein
MSTASVRLRRPASWKALHLPSLRRMIASPPWRPYPGGLQGALRGNGGEVRCRFAVLRSTRQPRCGSQLGMHAWCVAYSALVGATKLVFG